MDDVGSLMWMWNFVWSLWDGIGISCQKHIPVFSFYSGNPLTTEFYYKIFMDLRELLEWQYIHYGALQSALHYTLVTSRLPELITFRRNFTTHHSTLASTGLVFTTGKYVEWRRRVAPTHKADNLESCPILSNQKQAPFDFANFY